jgi:hypothetical protein
MGKKDPESVIRKTKKNKSKEKQKRNGHYSQKHLRFVEKLNDKKKIEIQRNKKYEAL